MNRHYGMDWLRIAAFGLLIFYHVGMVFVPWTFHIKTEQPVEWAKWPMLALNAWRLALLFVVSGYASAALMARSTSVGAFIRSRNARLLIPTLFAVLVVIPPQPWVELSFKHAYPHGFLYFWTHDYFRFGKLEGIVLPTWQHMWFVVYLWVYTLIVAAGLVLIPETVRTQAVRFFDRILSGMGGLSIILLPLALLVLRLVLTGGGKDDTHDLVGDGFAHQVYLSVFLFGWLLRRGEGVWTAIRRWWPLAAGLAFAGYGLELTMQLQFNGTAKWPLAARAAYEIARTVHGWCAIIALLGLADRFWNRDHPWRATLTEAVFPAYIIHQTIIVVAAYYLIGRGIPAYAQFAVLVVATAGGSAAFYFAGRSIKPLRPLIGLR